MGRNCRFLQGSEKDQAALEELREALEEGREWSGVLRNYRKSGELFYNEVSISPLRDEEGRLTHFIGVQRDVSERVEAEQELREREVRIRSVLVRHSSDVIRILDAEGTITYESPSLEHVLGKKPEEHIGKYSLDLIHPDDRERVSKAFAAIMADGGISPPVEYRLQHASGDWLYFEGIANNLLDEAGIEGIVINSRDITGRKQAEQTLAESEERSRAIVETAPNAIIIMSPNGLISRFNTHAERMFGYPADEAIGQPLRMLMPERFRDAHEKGFRRYTQTGEAHVLGSTVELAGLRRDGTEFPLELSLGEVHHGDSLSFVGILQDITDRKESQRALSENERRFRQFFEQSVDALLVHDEQGKILDANTEAARSLGYTREEMLSLSVRDFATNLVFEDRNTSEPGKTLWQRVLEAEPGETVGLHTGEHRRKDGTTFPVEVRVGAVEQGGKKRILASARDVTERLEAEKDLRESEEQFRSAFDDTISGMALVGLDGKYFRVNRALCEIFGYSEEELLDSSYTDLTHPDDRELSERHERRIRDGEVEGYQIEKRYIHADGCPVWVSLGVTLVRDSENRPSHFISQIQDVSDRVEAERRLSESQQRYASLSEHNPDGVFSMDLEGNLLTANPSMQEITGYSQEELLEKSLAPLVAPEDLTRVTGYFEKAVRGEPQNFESVMVCKDDRRVEVSATLVPAVVQGDLVGVYGIVEDISYRVEAERERRESEERFQTLSEATFEGIVIADLGDILESNTAFASMFGYNEPSELIGRSVLEFVAPDYADMVRDRITSASEEPYEILGVRKDGSTLNLEIRGRSSSYRDREVRIAAVRDITQHKRANLANARLAAIVQSSNDAIISRALDGTITSWNPGAEQLYGYSAEEMLGESLWNLYPPDRLQDRREISEITQRGEGLKNYETAHVTKDGRSIDVSLTVTPIRDDEGNVVGASAIVRDTTERKRREDELRESSSRLATLIESLRAGILVEDDTRHISRVNQEFCDMFSIPAPPQALTGTDCSGAAEDSKHFFEEPESFVQGVEERIREKIPVTGEEFSLVDGRTFERDYIPIFVDEEYRGHLWQYRDITARKQAEKTLAESEARFRTLFDQTAIGVCVADLDRRLIETNEAYQEITGYSAEELVGMSTLDLTHPEDRATDTGKRRTFVSDESDSYRRSKRYVRKDGEVIWAEATSSLVRDEQGEPRFIMGVVEDVTERKRSQEALRENERLLQAVTRGAPVILFATDHEGVLTLAEGKALDLFSLKPGKVVGRSVFEAYRDLTQVVDNVRRALAGEEVAETVELEGVTFEARYSPMRDGKGEITGSVGVATDVTTRRELEKEMEHRAFHDPLTDLPNRALFMDRLEHALTRTSRRGERVAVLFLDLDDFKHVNDSLGHSAGDRLLIAAGQRIKSCLRDEDTVARLGGDEFAVLLEDVPDLDFPKKVAQRIASELRSPITLSEDAEEAGPEIIVTTSIGMALNEPEDDSIDAEEILQRADTALYRAKETGKDHHELFHQEMKERSTEFLRMGRDLRRALEREELTVHYQLKKNLQTGEASGMEALVRWEHPERGLVYPDKFISLAEDNGLIVPLGLQVLREACGQAKEWQELYPTGPGQPPLAICVNLSVRQLQSPGLVEDVAGILAETGLEPSSALLEITESTFIRQDSQVTSALHSLKELGVKLAIDDFGSGYSSLSYLNDLPVDVLKIDRSLVTGMGTEPAKAEIVSAAISVAHALGLQAVAEGVETAGELEELRKLGCDFGQGYYWSKPLPANAAATLLQRPASK